MILYALVCEKEWSHMGKNNGNPDLVCENNQRVATLDELANPGSLSRECWRLKVSFKKNTLWGFQNSSRTSQTAAWIGRWDNSLAFTLELYEMTLYVMYNVRYYDRDVTTILASLSLLSKAS